MNGLLICVVIIFGQIYNNAGQEPPTQTAGDLTEFVSGPNDSVPELDTPSPTSEINQTRADDMANYDELVGSIFYQNSSLNEPDVIVPCNNGDLGPGECTHYYLCSDNRTILTDGSGRMVIDFRWRPDEVRECPLLKPCCSLKNDKPSGESIKKLPAACGLRNRNGLQFIMKNQPNYQAQEAEFPWTIAILERNASLKSDEESPFLCGGSLIHPQIVMTAAHCLVNKTISNLFIRAGEWDSLSFDEFHPHQDRNVDEMISHDQFNPANAYNDIALLVLRTPVEIGENVNTICLPPVDYDFGGQRCFASGWGTLSWRERHFLSIMKRIELPVVEHKQCQTQLRKTRVGIHFQLHESFVCAGGEKDVDTCRGDGGSPLVCRIPNTVDQYYQAGIVAWGIGCGDTVPGVYVNIAHLRTWIDEQMMRKNFEMASYDAEASKKINYRTPF